MLSGRPLLYLSLPGVAFILGVYWYRRRNKNRLESGDDDSRGKEDIPKDRAIDESKQNAHTNSYPTSKSLNINGGVVPDEDNTPARLFGKSAPIQIVQNGRASPVKTYQQQIDSEVLKTKIQNVEHKALRSIDEDFENLSSPVDLPDSVENRISFYSRTVDSTKDEPVVIKATTTPKISPENSFLESKYTNECEQNNNCKDPVEEGEESKSNVENTEQVDDNENQQEKTELQQTNIEDTPQKEVKETDINSNEKRDVDAASPSLSLCSIQSGDSGKGSSLPHSEANRGKTTYEFLFPTALVGQLYGRKRSFLKHIAVTTSANVHLRRTNIGIKMRVCVVEGTESEINAALALIRQRLPAQRYPNFTMQRIHYAIPQTIVPLSKENLLNLQLHLIEGINNDVFVSTVVTGGHIFVQHPLHPSHPSLSILQKCLYDSYTMTEAPLLPRIELSAVCVMAVNGIWYRVQIVNQDAEDEKRCIVKFLDFGGYMNVHFNELRQIRSDFMGLPFQATECLLSNIEPIGDQWSPEAADILCKLTKGIVLQAQVAGYNSNNVPEIYLFACLGPNNVIFINKELVARNLAKWVEICD